eukprot:3933319-Rhodomonas_salina.1
MRLPSDWWTHPDTDAPTACNVQLVKKKTDKTKKTYVWARFLDPADMRDEGVELQFPISRYFDVQEWTVRGYLRLAFNNPVT